MLFRGRDFDCLKKYHILISFFSNTYSILGEEIEYLLNENEKNVQLSCGSDEGSLVPI